MGLRLTYLPGETVLDADEMEGILIPTISRRDELDEFEQLNIQHAIAWSLEKNFTVESLFSVQWLTLIHKKMFGEVWSWAGVFRHTNKNIGVDKYQINIGLRDLCDDAKYWIQHNTYMPDEIAVYCKHRLVSIHPFPNGNGRFSRLVADIIITRIFEGKSFTWGNTLGEKARICYLDALHAADNGNIVPLLTFARQ